MSDKRISCPTEKNQSAVDEGLIYSDKSASCSTPSGLDNWSGFC